MKFPRSLRARVNLSAVVCLLLLSDLAAVESKISRLVISLQRHEHSLRAKRDTYHTHPLPSHKLLPLKSAVPDAAPVVKINSWWGRLGNQFLQLARALVYGVWVGARAVVYPQPGPHSFRYLDKILQLNGTFNTAISVQKGVMPGAERGAGRGTCKRDFVDDDLWGFPGCTGITAHEIHEVLANHLDNRIKPELSSCIQSRQQDDSLLTIHKCSGDMFDKEQEHSQHRQAPCAFYRKVIGRKPGGGRFEHVLVVTSGASQNPCVEELQAESQKPGATFAVNVQRRSVMEDACAILSAQNLVLSFSTFSHSLAMLSSRVRQLYATDFMIQQVSEWIDCRAWPGTALTTFAIHGEEQMRPAAANNKRWMLEFPDDKIPGPSSCGIAR